MTELPNIIRKLVDPKIYWDLYETKKEEVITYPGYPKSVWMKNGTFRDYMGGIIMEAHHYVLRGRSDADCISQVVAGKAWVHFKTDYCMMFCQTLALGWQHRTSGPGALELDGFFMDSHNMIPEWDTTVLPLYVQGCDDPKIPKTAKIDPFGKKFWLDPQDELAFRLETNFPGGCDPFI